MTGSLDLTVYLNTDPSPSISQSLHANGLPISVEQKLGDSMVDRHTVRVKAKKDIEEGFEYVGNESKKVTYERFYRAMLDGRISLDKGSGAVAAEAIYLANPCLVIGNFIIFLETSQSTEE